MQGLDLGVAGVDAVVQDHREPVGQLAEQAGGMEAHLVGDDLDDASVADLEAVAEGAMDHVAAPVLAQTVDVGEFVDQTGGRKHSPGDQRMPTGERDAEVVVVDSGDVHRATGDDLDSVAAHLVATDRGQIVGRKTLVPEIAVHVGGGGVAGLAGVDDDHGPALASELECGGKSSG